MAAKGKETPGTIAAQNRKARFDYFIGDKFEAGIMLTGTEVKSLRAGKASLVDAWAAEKNGELWLQNAHIAEYTQGNRFNHEPRRPRKLLLHKRQIEKLIGSIQRQGVTLVPLSIYFNDRGMAKVDLAVGTGKKQHDKRASIKDRDWQRDKQRLMRNQRD